MKTRQREVSAILCYTNCMDSGQTHWEMWALKLRRWGLVNFMTTLLEGTAPIRTILAQFVYIAAPLFTTAANPGWQAFAEMLESPEQAASFAHYLQEGKPS